MKKTLFLVAACAVMACAMAQDFAMPSAEAIAKQRQSTMDSMGSVDPKSAPMPTSRTIKAGNTLGASLDAARDLSGAYKDVSKATRDQFEKLARGKQVPMQRERKSESDLIIFVSLSMPRDMLMSYAQQAKRFGGILMMRGFVDDKLSATREAIDSLKTDGVEWQISPEPFKKFKVTKVPSFVLASADADTSVTEDGCATPDVFTMISGDIKVIDALDKIKVLGQPKIAALAGQILLADRAAGNQRSVK